MILAKPTRRDQYYSVTHRAIVNLIATNNWLVNALNDAIAEHDITLNQYSVLRLVLENDPEPLACGAVSERLIGRTPDLTRLLDRLEKQDLITRTRARQDRRVIEIALTAAGRSVTQAADETLTRAARTLVRNLSIDERLQMSDFLERLRTDALP